jgi:formylglycine-generating enzyme required for sulfatase activity
VTYPPLLGSTETGLDLLKAETMDPTPAAGGTEAKERRGGWGSPRAGAGALAAVLAVLALTGCSDKDASPDAETPQAAYHTTEFPKPGMILPSPEVVVRGTVQPGVSIYLNGAGAAVDGDRFRLKVRLPGIGKQALSILAVKGDRNRREDVEVVVDVNPPRIEIEGFDGGATLYTRSNPHRVEGRLLDEHAHRLSLNGAVVGLQDEGWFALDIPLPPEGRSSVVLEGTDAAGHSTRVEFTVILDAEPPEVSLVSPAEGWVGGDPDQNLRFRFSEPVVSVKAGGKPVSPSVAEFLDVSWVLVEGENAVVVEAEDRGGNPVKATFTVRYLDPESARREAAETAWRKALSVVDGAPTPAEKIDAVEAFLKTHGGTSREAEAKERLAALHRARKAAETEAAFRRAVEVSDAVESALARIEAYERFLVRFPEGAPADKARARIREIRDRAIPLKVEGVDLAGEAGTFRNVKDDALLVHLPAGSLPFGTVATEEGPAPRTVSLSAFYIYRCEVTNRQFARFMNSGEGKAGESGAPLVLDCMTHLDGRFPWGLTVKEGRHVPVEGCEDHPVVLVTWFGANAYAKWAGGSLPSEAQWRYAGGGSKGTPYPWGETAPDETRARFGSDSPSPAGAFPGGASPFGARDMAGNVWEWCLDRFVESPAFPDESRDPVCEEPSVTRVLKGGGYKSGASSCTTTARSGLAPRSAHPWLGFRVVLKNK